MPDVSSEENEEVEESIISEEGRDSTLERDDHEDANSHRESKRKFSGAGGVVTKREYTLPDGSRYTGQWDGNKRHGNGKLLFPDGGIYDGEWVNDKPHGYGERIHPDGSMYKGQFVNGQAEGYGELSHGNHGLFIGQWK